MIITITIKMLVIINVLLSCLILTTSASQYTSQQSANYRFGQSVYEFKVLEKQQETTLVGKLDLIRVAYPNGYHRLVDNANNAPSSELEVVLNSTNNTVFKIDPRTFELRTNVALTASRMQLRGLLVNRYRPNEIIDACLIIVRVLDSVNRAPKFRINPYEVQVYENNAPDTFLIRVEANDDLDWGANGEIAYYLMGNESSTIETASLNKYSSQSPFQVKSDTGEIYAKRSLNREQRDEYVLYVLAIDKGPNRLSDITKVIIRVLAVSDSSLVNSYKPVFERSVYNVSVAETADFIRRPLVLRVHAYDAEILNGSTPSITYSLSGNLNDLNTFEIDAQSGSIHLVSKLNYALKPLYKLTVRAHSLASMPPCASQAEINIVVDEASADRAPPTFAQSFYEFLASETPQEKVVGRVRASADPLANDEAIEYAIDGAKSWTGLSSSGADIPFKIDPRDGRIFVERRLVKSARAVYEFYVTSRIVRSGSHSQRASASSIVKVKIRVLDINDNVPEFAQKTYTISVSEDTTMGLPLLSLNIINRDSNAQLEFSIELDDSSSATTTAQPFTLLRPQPTQSNKVYLTLDRSYLNYRKRRSYQLRVKCVDLLDGLYSSALVEVRVQPNTNFRPRFERDIYRFDVWENATVGWLLGQIQAIGDSSGDQNHLQTIVYKLVSNDIADSDTAATNMITSRPMSFIDVIDRSTLPEDQSLYFRLNELTGQLFISSQLDREQHDQITLYVSAAYRETPTRSDHAIIQIHILDCNDNAPTFTRPHYTARVHPNTRANASLFRVEAIDKDAEQNGIVTYSIDENTMFAIDPQSGVVRLRDSIRFDDQTLPDYFNLTIRARDSTLSSATFAIVYLDFTSKLPPRCDYDRHRFEVRQSNNGGFVGLIRARDPDLGLNADLSFKLLRFYDLFELKSSGLFNSVSLAVRPNVYLPKSKVYELTVRVYSGDLYTDCSVEVRIKECNESYFSVPKRFKLVFNNYKSYFLTERMARVPIQDDSLGLELKYSLVDSVGKQLVNLNERTGEIALKPLLNSNNQINASFEIEITDRDNENRVRTTCELIVSMVTDNMIRESVTLSLFNIDLDLFLSSMYESFFEAFIKILPPQIKRTNVHLFSLDNSSNSGLNLTFAVSYDYEKDIFMPSELLKQIVESNIGRLEAELKISHISLYTSDSSTCSIEPCLNYQQCLPQTKFDSASANYQQSTLRGVQFRSIGVQHDFACRCPLGFTGTNTSVTCDLEINLCYSNPCRERSGRCVSVESGYVCVCEPGWTGRSCEFNLAESKCCPAASAASLLVPPSAFPQTTTVSAYSSTSAIRSTNSIDKIRWNTTSAPIESSNQCIQSSNIAHKRVGGGGICQGTSRCKNLILGGCTCDQCDLHRDAATRNHATAYCELRTRSLKGHSHSYFALAGLSHSRSRFSISLSLSTIKSDAYVFYQRRLNSNGGDFLALRIVDDRIRVEYSLGDAQLNYFNLDDVSVSDGRRRTLRLEYAEKRFRLALDNDALDEVNACDLARNANVTNKRPDCFRTEHEVKLPDRCNNQIENCFRFFDLDGPLVFGKSPERGPMSRLNEEAFEGCIGDIYINERLSNLRSDSGDMIAENNTRAGCPDKIDECKSRSDELRSQCTKCSHIWSRSVKCECRQGDDYEFSDSSCRLVRKPDQVVTLADNGYLDLNERQLNDDLRVEFGVKTRLSSTNSSFVLLNMRLINMFVEYSMRLVYDWSSDEMKLMFGDNEVLIVLRKNRLLDDEYWTKIEIDLRRSGLVKLSINGLFEKEVVAKQVESLFGQKFVLKWSIHGPMCVRGIRVNNDPSFGYRAVNAIKGCTIKPSRSNSIACLSQLYSRTVSFDVVSSAKQQHISTSSADCNDNQLRRDLCASACFNGGTCTVISNSVIANTTNEINYLDGSTIQLSCSCSSGYRGRYCENSELLSAASRRRLSSSSKECPAKWWGRGDQGICGPCECDETKNFSPDCNKTNGQCFCKPKFYKKINQQTQEEYCVPCECSLEGSTSLQCSPVTGQCPCLQGAGITGRRCDQCVSPLAEMISSAQSRASSLPHQSLSSCRQLSTQECPKQRSFDTWWPRTRFDSLSNASCPRGSRGVAYRSCSSAGWLRNVDLTDCQSVKIADAQLVRLADDFDRLKSELNSYQAIKLVEDLSRLTREDEENFAEVDEGYNLGDITEENSADKLMFTGRSNLLAVNEHSLYALDLLVIRNITRAVLEYEAANAPSFLFIQDKFFLANLFGLLNRMLDKRHDLKLSQFVYKQRINSEPVVDDRPIRSSGIYTELLVSLQTYLQSMTRFEQESFSSGENSDKSSSMIEVAYPYIQLQARSLPEESSSSYTATIEPSITFTLINSAKKASTRVAYVSINTASTHLPNSLFVIENQRNSVGGKSTIKRSSSSWLISSYRYRVVSNVLILVSESNISDNSTDTLIVEFALTNNFETRFDQSTSSLQYRQLKTVKSDYNCARLVSVGEAETFRAWSTRDAKLISYDAQANVVKCAYEIKSTSTHSDGMFAVVSPHGSFTGSNNSAPIGFSIAFRVIVPIALAILLFTALVLVIFTKIRTTLSIIYANLCVTTFIAHFLFVYGINANKSQLGCKLIAIAQYYFSTCGYLWYAIGSVHLYRMLTELRDINTTKRSPPLVYYLAAYILALLSTGLTLGLKNDLFTNFDSTLSLIVPFNSPAAAHHFDMSSLFCWLNVNQQTEIVYAYFVPILMLISVGLILLGLAYRQLRLNTFKQTDVGLANQSILASLILLPLMSASTLLMFMLVSTSSSVPQAPIRLPLELQWSESSIYECSYIAVMLILALFAFLLLVVANRPLRISAFKWCSKISERIVAGGGGKKNQSPQGTHEARKTATMTRTGKSATNAVRFDGFDGFIGLSGKPKQVVPVEFVDVAAVTAACGDGANYAKKFITNNNMGNKYIIDYNTDMCMMNNNSNSISTTSTSETTNDNIVVVGKIIGQQQHQQQQQQHYQLGESTTLNEEGGTTTTTTTSSDLYPYELNSRPSETQASCDVVDVGKVLRAARQNYQHHQELQLCAAKFNPYRFESRPPMWNGDTTSYMDATTTDSATTVLYNNNPLTANYMMMNKHYSSGEALPPPPVHFQAVQPIDNSYNSSSTNQSNSPPNSNSYSTTSSSSLINAPIPNGMGSYNVATSKAVNLEFIQASNSPLIPNVPLFSGNLVTNEEADNETRV